MTRKIALITGAASGIGLAIAQILSQDMQVIICDIDETAGRASAATISASFEFADLAQAADCKALIDRIESTYGSVDVLVNNAGFQHISAIADFPEAVWNNMLQVMLTAPFLLTKYVWPGMQKKQWGRIINIASVHAQVASLYKAGYITCKHGLIGLTKTAALEGGSCGITVNAICPAYVRTPLVDKQVAAQAASLGITEEQVITDVFLKNAAIKRMIEPDEIGHMVAYLCSSSAAAVTGSSLNIDLGWTAQ